MKRRDLWRRTCKRGRTGRHAGTPASFIPTSNAQPRTAKVPFGHPFYAESGTRALVCMKNHSVLIKNPPNNSHTLAEAAALPRGSRASDCFVLDLYDAPLTSIALASVDAGRAGTSSAGKERGKPSGKEVRDDSKGGTSGKRERCFTGKGDSCRKVGLLGKAWWD